MSPVVDGIERKYKARLVVRRVNANEEDGPAIMRAYRIPGHPTTLIFTDQGQEAHRFIGPQPAELVETSLNEILN